MANLDGDITLSVDVTPGDIKSTATEIQKEFEGIFKQTSAETLSSEFNRAKVSAVQLYDEMSKLVAKMTALETTSFKTDEFKALSEEFDKTDQEYTELAKHIQEMGVDPDSDHTYRSTMDEMLNKLETLQSKMDELRMSGRSTYSGTDTEEYSALASQLNNVTNKAALARDRLQELNFAEATNNATLPPLSSRFGALGLALREVSSRMGSAMEALSSTRFGPVISYLKTVYSWVSKVGIALLKMGGSAITSGISKLANSMKGLTKHTHSQNNALQIGFKNFIRYGLGVRSLFALINKFRRAFMEGIGNLAQYSPAFNSVISDFVSSLATLKNAFAAAFAPVISVVLPILTTLMNALIDAMAIIGKFFAALTGKDTFIQARHVNIDYAKSLDKTASSAGGASDGLDSAKDSAKELQKTIAGFDDVEILKGPDKDTGSGASGAGGGGGGGAGGGINPGDMFETVGIESPIADFANRIRELIANQDWEGLGTFLGETINSVFEKAKQLISWDNLGDRITFVVNAITTTFNSLVKTINWDLIGSTFAEGINTILRTLNLLITGINWGLLGESFATGLNALVRDIKWELLGLTLGYGINSAFRFLYNAITTFNWQNLGQSLATALSTLFKTIDWDRVGKTFAGGVNALLNLLYGFITTFDWEYATTKLMSAINSFIREVDWKKLGSVLSKLVITLLTVFKTVIAKFDWYSLGQSVVKFLSGIDWSGAISTALATIAQIGISALTSVLGLGGGIFSTLLRLISTGIAYAKEYINQHGGSIIQGLLAGISTAVKGIGKWIITNIFNPFITGFKNAFGIKSPSKVMKKQGEYIIQGLFDGIKNKWTSIKTFFTEKTKDIVNKFKNTDWKGTGSHVVEKIKNGASSSWSAVKSFFSRKITDTKGQFTRSNWKPGGTAIVNGIRSGAVSVWADKVAAYFTTKITELKNKFNNADFKTIGQNVVTHLKSGISAKFSEVTGKIGDLVSSIKSKFTDTNWKSLGEDICSGIKSGISNGWDWVTTKAKELAGAAYDAAAKKLEINSPSKVFRDGIGIAIPEGIAAGIDKGSDLAMTAVENLSKSISGQDMPQLKVPSIALGGVIPYEMNKNIDTLNETMKTLSDVLQYNQSNQVTREDIAAVLNTVLPTMLQRYVSFYIGDEDIARHANAGNLRLDYRFNPTGR